MFRKPGNTFLGLLNTPDDPPGHIRADSPRHHWNRNGAQEQFADEVIRKLEPRLVRDSTGLEFEVSALAGTKEGWSELGPVREKPPTHDIWLEPARELQGIPAKEHRQARSVPEKALLAKGWIKLRACTKGREQRAPMSDAEREHHQFQLDTQAHVVRHGDYPANRPRFFDGTELITPMDNDSEMVTRVHPRGTVTPKIEGKP